MWDSIKQQKERLLDPEAGEEPLQRQKQQYEPNGNAAQDATPLCADLSYQERLIGCGTCFLLGLILSLGSTLRLFKLATGNPFPFAMAYSLGNVLSLASTMFFVGPMKQFETMFRQKRRGSAILYLALMVTTLVLCLVDNFHFRALLVMFTVAGQFLALIWYTLSYIPYGRNIALSCCKSTMGMANEDEL